MTYSIDPIQDNCYPGTTVLVNKPHIHDEATLQEAETLATYVNASKLEQCPLEGVFDFAHAGFDVGEVFLVKRKSSKPLKFNSKDSRYSFTELRSALERDFNV